MGKGLSLNVYTQANAGLLRNADGNTYSNVGVSLGADGKAMLSQKDAIIGGVQVGTGTAMTADASIGYQRNIGNRSELKFTANASYNRSLTNTKTYTTTSEINLNFNGQEQKIQGLSSTSWHPSNLTFSGKASFNKTTSWGGYEVGVEAGYQNSLSPDITFKSETTLLDQSKDVSIMTGSHHSIKHIGSGFVAFDAGIHANLTKNGALQAFAEGNTKRGVEGGIRFTF